MEAAAATAPLANVKGFRAITLMDGNHDDDDDDDDGGGGGS